MSTSANNKHTILQIKKGQVRDFGEISLVTKTIRIGPKIGRKNDLGERNTQNTVYETAIDIVNLSSVK